MTRPNPHRKHSRNFDFRPNPSGKSRRPPRFTRGLFSSSSIASKIPASRWATSRPRTLPTWTSFLQVQWGNQSISMVRPCKVWPDLAKIRHFGTVSRVKAVLWTNLYKWEPAEELYVRNYTLASFLSQLVPLPWNQSYFSIPWAPGKFVRLWGPSKSTRCKLLRYVLSLKV